MHHENKKTQAFTIVELLVVIVVIGILAAITTVSYSGIQKKAAKAIIKSQLSSNSKALKLYNTEYGYYPSSLDANDCPLTPTPSTNYCVKNLNGGILAYSGGGQSYVLTQTYNGITYQINESGTIAGSSFINAAGTSQGENSNALSKTSDGGYVTVGATLSVGNGDATISKYTSNGLLSWSKTWGGASGEEKAFAVTQINDGGYIAVGTTQSYSAGTAIATLITKFQADGTHAWSKTWGGSTVPDYMNAITSTSDGGFAIAGQSSTYGNGGNDAFIAKYLSDGSLSWMRMWGGTSPDTAYGIKQLSDDSLVITGYTQSFGTGTDGFIVKYSSTGVLSWNRNFGGVSGSSETMKSVTQLSGGTIVMTGQTFSDGAGSSDTYIVKYTSTGTLSCTRTWGGTLYEIADSIYPTTDGGFVVAGKTTSFGIGGNDAYIAKYDSSCTHQWSKTIGGTGNDYATAIIQDVNDRYLLTGYTSSFGLGGGDALSAKYNADGSIDDCLASMCQDVNNPGISSPSNTNMTTTPLTSSPTPTHNSVTPTVTTFNPTSTAIITQ